MLARDYLSGINPVYWQFWLGAVLVVLVLGARGGLIGAAARIRLQLVRRRWRWPVL